MALSTRRPARKPVPTASLLPPVAREIGHCKAAFIPWPQAHRENERRQCPRRGLQCDMILIDNVMEPKEFPAVVPGECLDISDRGLYGAVPIGYGVAIGLSFTFRVTTGERGPEPGMLQILTQRGKIVRAELLVGAAGYGDRVGIGVQLCGLREGMVPMPSRI